jgi:hypothetical protein
MSTVSLPGGNQALDEFHERLLAFDANPPRVVSHGTHMRRRGSLAQGRALESLGHAVEYLMDSDLFQRSSAASTDNQAAIQILKGLSRAVFLECPEVVPLRRRLGRWSGDLLNRARLRRTA